MHGLGLVYRDLKTNHVVFYKTCSKEPPYPVIIDFGKCQKIEEGTQYHLTSAEQVKYLKKYKHIAPDLIDGQTKPTPRTDVYSFG